MKSPNLPVSDCYSRPNPLRLLIVPALLTLCLGVFMATPAFACHSGKPHGKSTGCDGGGGGSGGAVTGGATYAAFIGPDVLDEGGARLCSPIGDLTEGAGRFDCNLIGGVRITTAAMNLQARKSQVSLCKSLQYFSAISGVSHVDAAPPMTPDVYQYGWVDSCGDGACQIVVDLSFSGENVLAATGGRADAVDLRVSGTLSAGSPLGNPFESHLIIQQLAMSQVNMQFRKPGSTTVAAVCDWYPGSTTAGEPQSVVFTSLALPLPPSDP